jgi:hypothetical protein
MVEQLGDFGSGKDFQAALRRNLGVDEFLMVHGGSFPAAR